MLAHCSTKGLRIFYGKFSMPDFPRRRPRLGAAFLSRTDAAMATIQRAPEACRKSHGEYRHLVLRRFPFGVFYLFDGETIAVVAVLPLRQNPASTREALE